jgi:AcrR family transcriptional regulator
MTVLSFRLNDHLYLRDPQHTILGQNIIRKSVALIDQLGFEQFTFKKLAAEIDSTEASVYRYFENKHRLLHYLISWYWSWLEYRVDLATVNVLDPEARLKACLRTIAEEKKHDPSFEFVNEEALYRIVVEELDKTYLTKWVDADNEDGLFGSFKTLCNKIAGIIQEINPNYEFPNALISTVLLAAKQQYFFLFHLPSLSNIKQDQLKHEKLYEFLETLVFNTIKRQVC